MSIEQAMGVLQLAMVDDPNYAHVWHCNIAMMCYDAIKAAEITAIDAYSGEMSHEDALIVGNDAASRFMALCFDVETSQEPLWAKSSS